MRHGLVVLGLLAVLCSARQADAQEYYPAGGGGSSGCADPCPAANVSAGTFANGDFAFRDRLDIGTDDADGGVDAPATGVRFSYRTANRLSLVFGSGMPVFSWETSGSATGLTSDSNMVYKGGSHEFRLLNSAAVFGTASQNDAGANGGANTSHRAMQFLDPGVARPTCIEAKRGWLWYENGGAGVADTVSICVKDETDTYAWVGLIP